ncbi:uncharacterized protein LOC115276076 isoform X2 [Suricata suricatta]|uniref:uncharacterized protein LOC115276076 isoform X2 n=1 Tax=Suricata suricatta TaxID=37032 RepID=UPI00115591A0|nr:uncharacterized protein LOC115276076 isoform X2 [Suricata suricatta]
MASFAFPSPTAIFASRNNSTRYLETRTSYPRPNGTPKPDLHVKEVRGRCEDPGSAYSLEVWNPHSPARGRISSSPGPCPLGQPWPRVLTNQRPQSSEAAKHSHRCTRLKARRPSRAPRPLDPTPWGVSGGPRPGGAAAGPSVPSFPVLSRLHPPGLRFLSNVSGGYPRVSPRRVMDSEDFFRYLTNTPPKKIFFGKGKYFSF